MAQTFTLTAMGAAPNDGSGVKGRDGGLLIAADLEDLYAKITALEATAGAYATYETDVVVSGVEQNITVFLQGDNFFFCQVAVLIRMSITGTSADEVNGITLFGGTISWAAIVANQGQTFLESSFEDQDGVITVDPLPAGITALTCRVIIKGFFIPKS